MTRWLLLLGIGMSGCAFALAGPEGTRPHTYPRCDNDKGRVVGDALIATALGITALAVASGSNSSAAVVPALGGALFVASAVRGNTIVNECRKAQESFIAQATPLPVPPPDEREERPPITSPVPLGPATAEPAVAPKPRPRPAPPAPPPPSDDPWSAFWKVTP